MALNNIHDGNTSNECCMCWEVKPLHNHPPGCGGCYSKLQDILIDLQFK